MCEYKVLRESRTSGPHVTVLGAMVEHRMWHVRVGDRRCYISWISLDPEGNGPECMAFPCSEEGDVTDWAEIASSRSGNPNEAFAEVIDQLLVAE